MFDIFGSSDIFGIEIPKRNNQFLSDFKFQKNKKVVNNKKLNLNIFLGIGISLALGLNGAAASAKNIEIPKYDEVVEFKYSNDSLKINTLAVGFNEVKEYNSFLSGNEINENAKFDLLSEYIVLSKSSFENEKDFSFANKIIKKIKNKNLNYFKFPEDEEGFWIQSGIQSKPFSIFVKAGNVREGEVFFMNAEGNIVSSGFSGNDFSLFDERLTEYIKNIC